MKSAIAVLALMVPQLHAHSWARCVDYHAEITGLDYDENQCTGWIRGWEFTGVDFGQDRGINYQVGVGGGQSLCQSTLSGTSDTDYGYPNGDKIAQYKSGETVRLVWPAKNHANYECSSNIPDTSMKLYMNPQVNPSSDISNSQSTMLAQGYELVQDWHEGCTPGSDGCGFMNCPRFCENTDRATCFGDFVVPEVDASGYYTFVWYWIFNPGSPYISCYEAYIDAEAVEEEDTDANDAFDASSGSQYDGQTVSKYQTQVPICIDGMDYDANQVENFVCNMFDDEVDCDDIEIVGVDEGNSGYNFTAQIYHDSPSASIVSIAWGGSTEERSEFCDDFENLYSTGSDNVACDNCRDTITYALYTSGTLQNGASLVAATMMMAMVSLSM